MTRVVLIVLAVGLPLGWLLSEFSSKRALRIVLGILALLSSFAVACFVGMLVELNYNAWYGSATKELLTTTIGQIEDGNLQRVLTVLRGLDAQYRPTREHRADYRALVNDATARMRPRGTPRPSAGQPGAATGRATPASRLSSTPMATPSASCAPPDSM